MNPVEYGNGTRALEALEVASHLSVVSGSPDESELAALVAGIAAAVASNGGGTASDLPDADAPAGAWSSRAHQRGVVHAGADAWRWAGR